MTVWDDRVTEAEIRTRAETLLGAVEAANPADDEEREHLDRTGRVAERIVWLVENVDPGLMTAAVINNLSIALGTAAEYIHSYNGGAGREYLIVNTLAVMDDIAAHLGSIPIPSNADEAIAESPPFGAALASTRARWNV